jgi:hypothetical protein
MCCRYAMLPHQIEVYLCELPFPGFDFPQRAGIPTPSSTNSYIGSLTGFVGELSRGPAYESLPEMPPYVISTPGFGVNAAVRTVD